MPYKPSLLIVEDEVLIAASYKKMVEEHFNVTAIAADYDEAARALEYRRPDIALIDVTLRGTRTGLDVANMLNGRYSVPFIFLTAHSDPATLQKILALNPRAYLVKPVQKVNLVTALQLVEISRPENFVTLNIGTEQYRINADGLLYARAEHIYVTLFFHNARPQLLRISLQKFLELLPQNTLMRINRSEAVNPSKITRTTKTHLYIGSAEFRISSKYFSKASS